jgi:hypothetical protein
METSKKEEKIQGIKQGDISQQLLMCKLYPNRSLGLYQLSCPEK